MPTPSISIAQRFRGFLPIIIDVETGGLNAATDALLEIAAVIVDFNDEEQLVPIKTISTHVQPFAGANIDPEALKINKIDPDSPLRGAINEAEALKKIFTPIREKLKESDCNRAILTGHNPILDLNFLNKAVSRSGIKRNPFHPFSSFDTATLAGLAVGQTVLAISCKAAGIEFDYTKAHGAHYDAEKTAELFCLIVNRWQALGGWPLVNSHH
ncbi:ribonuclease T [Piscirickettsia salmonis]|uniref:Ribonuclease T n=1 Tax=Piscirickettsia salmonis TaxID=1238 RepID=A0A9Q6LUG4_PISSA|nr:ribonuclease T [Piscirickettsia salmonis]ALA23959.1 ribonuclease T [Piscirickettsia salmonis]APS44372.1 ribonuclease T [Piscirickettsia salmonis]APS47733.1 ribonuclease T [Piscirickettsia salmonis]APS50837.1 ribonuclease T [Piscirickettsia salmonis]APS54041.1 ribonuclease T [Piscirickettsia salmonis]